MAPPHDWPQGFDLVVEVYTLQVLPDPLRRQAITPDRASGPPRRDADRDRAGRRPGREPPPSWPLTRAEVEPFTASGLRPVRIERVRDDAQSLPVRRWRAEFARPGHPDPERPAAPHPAGQGARRGVGAHGRQPAVGGQAAATPSGVPGTGGLPAGLLWGCGPAPGRPGHRNRAAGLGVRSHPPVNDLMGRGAAGRGVLRCGQPVRRPHGRRTGRLRRATGDLATCWPPAWPSSRYVLQPPQEIRQAAAGLGFTSATLAARGHDELDARVTRAYEEFVPPGQFTFKGQDNADRLHTS
jgi:hypothetical protein